MIKADEQGNLYTLSDNSGYFTLKGLPKISGKVIVVFNGDSDVVKEFDKKEQVDIVVRMSKNDIETIGVGTHRYYVDFEYGDEKDTLVYQTITVGEKDL